MISTETTGDQIEQLPTASLIPYARNARESVWIAKRRAATFDRRGQHRDIVEKRKRLRVRQKVGSRQQSRVKHVVMIWTQRYKVRQIAGAAVLYTDDVVNSSCVLESTQNAFPAVSDSCRIFAGSVARFWNSSESTAVRFLSAFIRAEGTLLTSSKSRWSDSNRIAADFTRDGLAIIEWVVFSGSRSSKCITTITRTVNAIRQIRADLKHVATVLTGYFGWSLSSSSTIVA